jgi:hypothetical protein
VAALNAPPQPAAPVAVASHAFHAAPVAAKEKKARNKMPLAFAAVGALVAIGVGAWLTLGSKSTSASVPETKLASAALVPIQQAPKPVIAEPFVASATPEVTTTALAASGTVAPAAIDEAAQKKAFEDAVKNKLDQELIKLQAQYTRQLQQQQSKNAPIVQMNGPPWSPELSRSSWVRSSISCG